jgi:hypothetical protein
MKEQNCLHQWTMINIRPGFIITESCYKCQKISCYFSNDEKPPLEEYRDGDHFWNVMQSAQTFRFELECTACHIIVQYDELLGLMMCTGCDENCKVEHLRKELEKERTWVYVAYGFLPVNEVKRLGQEKIAILEEYFNQRRKTSKSKIKIVSYEMISNVENCYAEVIKDVGLLSLKATEQ